MSQKYAVTFVVISAIEQRSINNISYSDAYASDKPNLCSALSNVKAKKRTDKDHLGIFRSTCVAINSRISLKI